MTVPKPNPVITPVKRALQQILTAGRLLGQHVAEGKTNAAEELAAELDQVAAFATGYAARIRAASGAARDALAPYKRCVAEGSNLARTVREQSARFHGFVLEVNQARTQYNGALDALRSVSGLRLATAEASAQAEVQEATQRLAGAQDRLAELWRARVETERQWSEHQAKQRPLMRSLSEPQRVAQAVIEGESTVSPVAVEAPARGGASLELRLVRARTALERAERHLRELRAVAALVDGRLAEDLEEAEQAEVKARRELQREQTATDTRKAEADVKEWRAHVARVANWNDLEEKRHARDGLAAAERHLDELRNRGRELTAATASETD